MNTRAGLLLAVLTLHIPPGLAKPHQAIDSIDALDKQISMCLNYLAEGRINDAGLLARQMSWRFPNFALGHLIAAEMESVRALQDVKIADHQPMERNVTELLLEGKMRLAAQRLKTPSATTSSGPDPELLAQEQALPGDMIQVGKHLSQVLVVDVKGSVLSHYDVRLQKPALVRQHYVGSGEGGFGKRVEGDLKTPLGVYSITGFRTDESLPDLYGSGALTLDYPNALDRHLGRTGYGIWLHGVPTLQRSRRPYSSEGCVTMSNQHLSRLSRELDAATTRIILTNDPAPLSRDDLQALQKQFRELFRTYQQAQLTGNMRQLMTLRTAQSEMSDEALPIQVSIARAALIQPPQIFPQLLYKKAFSDVKPEDISIFRHPDISLQKSDSGTFVVTEAIFGLVNEYQISIYWIQSADGEWQILNTQLTGPRL